MSTINGSSNIFSLTILGYSFGITGPTGFTGSDGPRGDTGFSIVGPTGPRGATLVNISRNSDNSFLFTYTDTKTQKSTTEVIGHDGYVKVTLSGTSLGLFSPLSNSLKDQNFNKDYPVDILTFKGLSSASSQFITINYSTATDPTEAIQINYNAVGIGYIGISGGTLGNILQNLPGQFQAGITSTTYNSSNESVLIQHKNVHEAVVISKPTLVGTNIAYWNIDPALGSVFYIRPTQTTLVQTSEINGYVFFIKRPSVGSLSKAITIYFPDDFSLNGNKAYYVVYDDASKFSSGITFGNNFFNNFDIGGVEWQNNSYFCPASNKFNILNLISLGGRYLAIPAQYDQSLANTNTKISVANYNESCYPYGDVNIPTSASFFTGGLCCPATCGSSAFESLRGGCTGFFYSTKRLSDSSVCTKLGACCISFGDGTVDLPIETTFCECNAQANGNIFAWNPYQGLKTKIRDFDCTQACVENNTGACCDGVGGCTDRAKSDCDLNKFFYQGNCTKCNNSDGAAICSGATGACCNSGITCSNGVTFGLCVNTLHSSFIGDQTLCEDYDVKPDAIPCSQTVLGISELKQGDQYSGGTVVGLFDPNSSRIYGNITFNTFTGAFTDVTQNFTALTNKALSQKYNCKYDFYGYGVDKSFGQKFTTNDQYLIVVANKDIEINNNKLFKWSKQQVMWGPLYNSNIQKQDFNIPFNHEGVVLNQANQTIAALRSQTFVASSIRNSGQATQWLNSLNLTPNTNNGSGLNGFWRRNYGLYNTAKILGSKFEFTINQNGFFAPNPSISGDTIIEAISKFNIDNPRTSVRESDWFIPSHDEMGYISNLCQQTTDFNLNSFLMLNDSQQIDGTYWTSTGAFKTNINEGLFGFAGLQTVQGSFAWTHTINSNNPYNTQFNYSIAEQRQSTYKIRPIKIIRCDGAYPNPGDEIYPVWRLPITST